VQDYYVNNRAQLNGDHEVHTAQCFYLPTDRTYLGRFTTCQEAVREAKKYHSQVNGCAHCSPNCHTT
jgi:hypothetical protein